MGVPPARRVAAALAASLALAGCAAPGPSAPTASGLDAFYAQTLAWAPCGVAECASLRVPLDYGQPAGRVLTLPVRRLRATAEPRLGALFVNPGGPGGSGTAFVGSFPRAGLERYDIVGWDPRGVGGDSLVTCLQGAAADAYLDLDVSPDDAPETTALEEGGRAFGKACEASGASLLAHVSTQESARDLDILRAAAGEQRLTYYGASYGTLLGALYAQFFPDKVGRLVLDSAADPTGRPDVPQSSGFERALDAFADSCAARACGWGTTRAQVLAALTAWVGALDATPLPVGERTLHQTQAVYGIASLLYSGQSGWPRLETALASARSGDGQALLEASDRLFGRGADGTYGPAFGAAQAITCADQPRRSVADAEVAWGRDRAVAPFFGAFFGPDLGCTAWPTPPAGWVVPRAPGAAPILVVGATGDPATPYEWAQALAGTLASGRLLTYEGSGHVSFGGKSACVDEAVRAYLLDGTLPETGLRCVET